MGKPENEKLATEVTKRVMAAIDSVDLGEETVRVTIDFVGAGETATAKGATEVRDIPILKTAEERYVLGVVLEPLGGKGEHDSQKDFYSADEIRKAAHKYMEDYGTLGLQHQFKVNGQVKLLENWISRTDETIDGQVVKAGTWLMGIRVVDDELWDRVKKGDLTGFSIGGFARRTPVNGPQN